MVGIYKITNPEGKSYVGLSKEIEVRWESHKKHPQRQNLKLYESLTKYSGDSHTFDVIEEINITNLSRSKGNALLRKRERYWIKMLDTFYNGLNSNGGGSGCGSHTAESKRKISEANSKPKPTDFGANRKKWQHTEEFRGMLKNKSGKPIIVTSIDGKITKEFNNQIQAAKWIGVSPPVLQLILRKKPQRNGTIPTSTKGYKINYKEL
tara:strand:- start:19 stop:642 length:624 start_codon:yes stop_codon:yes gene_type:complete